MSELLVEYRNWLIEQKNIKNKSAHDYVSRLKRAIQLLDGEKINNDTLLRLKEIEEFNSLSVSVRSQIRRAVRLFNEFQNKEV